MAQSTAKHRVLLDIPPRIQWTHGNGYCGEMCVQSIGLFYGAWISQHIVRCLNKGEYLLQPITSTDVRDPIETLRRLHFTCEEWNWKDEIQPQYERYCLWMKRCLINKYPVMFGIFLCGDDCDDYDHIVPAVGIQYTKENEYDPKDTIIYQDLYSRKRIKRSMNVEDFGATRKSIYWKAQADDGCIPFDIGYGIAITGIIDENRTTLPVRLEVSMYEEPDPTETNKPDEMHAKVTVENLTIDIAYALLRYSSYHYVPTKGDAEVFLQSNHSSKHVFVATESKYIYDDPVPIITTKSVYYRCVPIIS